MEETQKASTGVGSVKLTTVKVLNLPENDLKDYYLKMASMLFPTSCTSQKSEYEILCTLFNEVQRLAKGLNKINSVQWNGSIIDIQQITGVYLLEESINKKERKRINESMLNHLKILSQLHNTLTITKKLTEICIRHCTNITELIVREKEKCNEDKVKIK